MEFIIESLDENITIEKIEEIYYNEEIDEFMVFFASVAEIMEFIEKYGRVEMEPDSNETGYGVMRFVNE